LVPSRNFLLNRGIVDFDRRDMAVPRACLLMAHSGSCAQPRIAKQDACEPTAEVANRKGKRTRQIKVVLKKLILVLVVVMSIPESGGIEDEKVSSPKWSNHCQPLLR
jgi:hypothetical protein